MAAKAVGYDLTATTGTATSYIYDQYGNMTSQTDALGRQTAYTYDTLGRLTTTTPPAGGVTTNTYDALGHLKTVANLRRERSMAGSRQSGASHTKPPIPDCSPWTSPLASSGSKDRRISAFA